MRPLILAALFLSFFGPNGWGQPAQSGDLWFWLPSSNTAAGKDSQIVRDSEYVSIKIEAAHVSYKSGYLENIKQIVVSSNVSFDLGAQKAQDLTIDKTWQKSNKNEDDIPANSLLATLSPASPNSLSIRVSFAGIGQDKFKSIFDVLSSPDVKTALNLSAASLAEASLATSIAQKFLASPYTSSNPKDVLSLSQDFVIYADRNSDRPDALREGYLVVISGSENKSDDLNRIAASGTSALRFDDSDHLLEMKAADGTWDPFTGNSYVVLSVTTDTVRGIDETSSWYGKFANAYSTTEKVLSGEPSDNVHKEAIAFWQQGSLLLDADPNYIYSERESIKFASLKIISDDLAKYGAPVSQADLAAIAPNIPANLSATAEKYNQAVKAAKLDAPVTIHVVDSSGKGVSSVPITFQDVVTNHSIKVLTNANGTALIPAIGPAMYSVKISEPGFSTARESIKVQPRTPVELKLKMNP